MMAMDLAGSINPGNLKAFRKDPERMLADFTLYTKSFSNFLTVTDNLAAANAKKKALLLAVAGLDIVWELQ